ncbi:MAG: hypothetical protein KDA99_14175, partial [Planctomycetales bacterium]|nr:hypothetical protein [Planctomycetales bacterium]
MIWINSIVWGLMVCPLILLMFGLLPSRIANSHVAFVRRVSVIALGILAIQAALVLLLIVVTGRTLHLSLSSVKPPTPGDVGILVDGIAAVMFALVTFVGFIVAQFSVRYLDGDPRQGRYYRWLSFTIASVSLMVISGSLLQYCFMWAITSVGLHNLLLHYQARPGARRAAWTKFAVSRCGDAFLMAAVIIMFRTLGTTEFAELTARANDLPRSTVSAIAWLVMLGAAIKSAQFPFHVWLPNTLETPTPVSALMHAGIVNAGGLLIVRLSPVMVMAPVVLNTLVIIGAITVLFAGLTMMTQSSVK